MSMQAVVHLDLAKVPVNQDLPQAHSRPQVSTLEEGPLVLQEQPLRHDYLINQLQQRAQQEQ